MLASHKVSAQTFTDSNLPIVIINTDIDPDTNQPSEIVDDPRVLANMKIIKRPDGTRNYMTDQSNSAFLNYDGRIDIEIRGSTSQSLDKKPYGLTTRLADNVSNNNVSLLGMPSENDWVLNSLAFDQSMLRDYLSYNLARLMGNYAPRTQYCEVVINGDYKGLYMLQEKIKADTNRVNVVKITTADTAVPNVTGGYITKADKTTGGDPVAWYMDSYDGDTAFIHELPKPEDVTPLQNTYIHGQFNSLQTAAGLDNISISSGFPSLIDIPSFVDFMISSEYASNVDSYQFSTYFHKDRAGKLRAGPIWDYNLTYGNDLGGMPGRSEFDVWQFDNGDNTGAKFWKDLFDNPTFKCYLSKRFHDLTQPGQPLRHNNIVTFIDQTVVLISEAEARDDQRWNSVTNWPNQINYVKTWLLNRITWMTNNIGPYTNCSPTVPQLVINRINYNPGTFGSFPVSNDQEFIEIKNAGSTTVTLTGIYFSYLGISYNFPNNSTLGAGQSAFIASNTATFQSRYGFAAFGQFTRNLSNNTQKLVLADAWGNVIDIVEYDDDAPWPNADGNGSYLQLTSTSLDNALASSWIATSSSLEAPQFSVSTVQLFPNPTNGFVNVSASSEISAINIFDISGRLVKTLAANSSEIQIDLNGFTSGIYLLDIKSINGSSIQKVVKQ
ncbi:MAG: T9SS type A sorting domain-containing protein [Flavobacterium sp.]|nr:MAG: T9SS type A sorting domain-containing protein [Flavobacterium sp.]